MSHAARARPERGEQRTMDLSAGACPNLCRMVRISDAGGGPTSRGHWWPQTRWRGSAPARAWAPWSGLWEHFWLH